MTRLDILGESSCRIADCWMLLPERRVARGDLVIDGKCIAAIEEHDCEPDKLVMPGLVNCHGHTAMTLVRGLGGIEQTRDALAWFRARVREAGFPGLHLQAAIYSEQAVDVSCVDAAYSGSTKDLVRLLGFDSVTHYQFVHFADCCHGYLKALETVKAEWERIHAEYPVPYYPHISVGWDNNPRYNCTTWPILTENTPENVKAGLRMAKDFSDRFNDVPLVTVNSWNEWTEMSYLEPDDVYGYGYLEAVRDVFLQSDGKGENADG